MQLRLKIGSKHRAVSRFESANCALRSNNCETAEQLQELVNRNSQNSSQPPSQDRPEQKPVKEPSGPPRKRGGQPGHRGHRRVLVDDADEVVIHKPTNCSGCGALLLGDDPAPYRHQVTELPIVKPKVIEHQIHSIDCPCCGQRNRGELPPEVARSWFGPNVISLVGLLMGRYRLSKRQVTHLLAECFGITIAASTVVNQQQVISQALAAPVAELEPVVKNEPVCNIDETSWRQRGAAKRPWLWTVVTAQVTLFRIAPSRSSPVARNLLGETYGGVAGTTPVVLEPPGARFPANPRTRCRFVCHWLALEAPGRVLVDEMGTGA